MGTPNKLTPEVSIEIIRRWTARETQSEIGKALHLNRGTVARCLREAHGIETPEYWRGGRRALQRPLQEKALPPPFVYPENPSKRRTPCELSFGEAERFWSKVAVPNANGCRLWLASLKADGAGQFGVGRTIAIAYRVAWRLTYGFIPDGMNVNHRCDVRACNEPTHLWLGTQAENLADMAAKGRAIGRHPGHGGEDNPTVKLTWVKVRQIRELREKKGATLDEIASRFKISKSQASNIVNYKQWVEPTPAE